MGLYSRLNKMGRMYSSGKGIARRCLPFRKAPPSWVQLSTNDLCEQIIKLARKGSTPSQIGVTLRDSYGIPQVKSVTGSKVLRILKKNGLAPSVPEDLYMLIKKAIAVRKHLESSARTETPSSASFALRAESTDSPATTATLSLSPPPGDTTPRRPTPLSEQ